MQSTVSKSRVTADQIIIGKTYAIWGNLVTSSKQDSDGNVIPEFRKTEITREICDVEKEKKRIRCVCGRVFLIDDDLILEKVRYENYDD